MLAHSVPYGLGAGVARPQPVVTGDGSKPSVLEMWNGLPEAERLAAWKAMTAEERAYVPSPFIDQTTLVSDEDCAWYQVASANQMQDGNQPMVRCEFAGARLLRPDYVYERLTGKKIGTDALLDFTPLLFNVGVYAALAYVLYSSSKGGK